ncbi:MAG: c-type cytochrome [Thermodesulfobacteriota bacterium]
MKRILTVLSVGLLAAAIFAAQGLAADGKTLFARCAGCHGADGGKKALGAGAPLKGMKAADVARALEGYKAGTYGGGKKAMMEGLAKGLSAEDIKALADYIATL